MRCSLDFLHVKRRKGSHFVGVRALKRCISYKAAPREETVIISPGIWFAKVNTELSETTVFIFIPYNSRRAIAFNLHVSLLLRDVAGRNRNKL